MSRDFRVYLDDVVEAGEKISIYLRGYDFERFKKDSKTFDAVIRNLLTIGEAVKNIPEQTRISYPEIEWKKIAGLRDILAHEYFGIDEEIVWDVCANKIPQLITAVRKILAEN